MFFRSKYLSKRKEKSIVCLLHVFACFCVHFESEEGFFVCFVCFVCFVFAESLLAETDIDASLFDFHLLRSLTVLQLFVACSEIPTDCNSFKTEFFSSVKVTLLKAKEEGINSSAYTHQLWSYIFCSIYIYIYMYNPRHMLDRPLSLYLPIYIYACIYIYISLYMCG